MAATTAPNGKPASARIVFVGAAPVVHSYASVAIVGSAAANNAILDKYVASAFRRTIRDRHSDKVRLKPDATYEGTNDRNDASAAPI